MILTAKMDFSQCIINSDKMLYRCRSYINKLKITLRWFIPVVFQMLRYKSTYNPWKQYIQYKLV